MHPLFLPRVRLQLAALPDAERAAVLLYLDNVCALAALHPGRLLAALPREDGRVRVEVAPGVHLAFDIEASSGLVVVHGVRTDAGVRAARRHLGAGSLRRDA